MAKFKVGDKVRFTDKCCRSWWFGPHTAHKEGVISGLNGLGTYEYQVCVDVEQRVGNVDDEHIELIVPSFKVGDRVVPSDKAGTDLIDHWNEYWSEFGEYEGAFFVTEINSRGDIKYSSKPGGDGPHFIPADWMTPAPLKLEAGKYYRTRNGKRVGPLMKGWAPHLFGSQGYSLTSEWYSDGRRNSGWETDLDIVAEWPSDSDDTNNGVWRSAGFFLDAPESTTNCIVALIENGQPKPATHPYVHPSRNKAETEAGRLARKHKGREFGVYELVVTKQEQAKHEWQRLALDGQTIDAIKKLREIAGMSLRAAKAAVTDCRAA
ncbi:hypothetical protein ACFPOD_05090 [Nitratireductor kimnyeongensis]|uniref:Uncharacterized protein n=1 Tax=Nitratireductor kimnyeongensis TaxID=430679 RepID=A0ABW0T514_9HYPH|nr:hypothetical protein [Nitratireductor kimnyeongensis]QZZ34542.1 hypothetical protein KW403_12110 [Nitratireductor kimnyeongensis]